MNHQAILALLSDLYAQLGAMQLRAETAEARVLELEDTASSEGAAP